MSKPLLTVVWGCVTVLGAAIFYWSGQLSVRYNAWTASFRERHPHINPPPTPETRELNTKIMAWLFRFLGALLFLLSILALIGIRNSN
jgi:hypothetical protein